jgi:hypothetical protein
MSEKRSIEETKFFSSCIGNLAKGCESCVKGAKTVIFVTGLCSRKCYFCPTSDEKQFKDVLYANERKIDIHDKEHMLSEIVAEVKLQNARGVGITGGDPLQRLERTCEIISHLKKTFDTNFHIHVYTPLELVDKNKLEKLFNAGLDEIRFHPDLDDDKLWKRVELARQFSWQVGVEIPVVPDKRKEIENLAMFLENQIDFLNLNELEVADNSQSKLVEMGYTCKEGSSYAVTDSETTAKEVMQFILEDEKLHYSVHYCSVKLKDGVQLAQRILRTGKNVKRPFEKITSEGLLERGIIYLPDLVPGFGHGNKIAALDTKEKDVILYRLSVLKKLIQTENKVKDSELVLDDRKLRLITSISIAKRIAKVRKDVKCAITQEYPTYDQIEIELDFLN